MHKRIAPKLLAGIIILACSSCGEENNPVDKDTSKGPIYEQELVIDAEINAVWSAITKPEIVNTYYLAPLAKLELEVGGYIVYGSVEEPLIAGRVLELELRRKLVHSFAFDPSSHSGVEANPASRVTYELRSEGEQTVLTLKHDQFGEDNQTYANVSGGWPLILSGLKERVEGESSEQ